MQAIDCQLPPLMIFRSLVFWLFNQALILSTPRPCLLTYSLLNALFIFLDIQFNANILFLFLWLLCDLGSYRSVTFIKRVFIWEDDSYLQTLPSHARVHEILECTCRSAFMRMNAHSLLHEHDLERRVGICWIESILLLEDLLILKIPSTQSIICINVTLSN